jgi:hypothetical protein
MRGEVGEGGIWRGRRFTGETFYGRWGIDFWGSWICREEWSFGVGLDQFRHRVAGGFRHGGQDINMISWS